LERERPQIVSNFNSNVPGEKKHHAAVRALAYKWIRILFRCWKTHKPYDPQIYLTALAQRSSPLAAVNNSSQNI
jgi:hypothetical protein